MSVSRLGCLFAAIGLAACGARQTVAPDSGSTGADAGSASDSGLPGQGDGGAAPDAGGRDGGGAAVTVTVTSTQLGPIALQLSTNNVWAGEIDQAPGAQQRFNALHDPLVRIHMGDDGTSPPALPEINPGQWDLSSLDSLVNDVALTGQKPMLNVKFAPDWMWTCYPNSVGVTNKQGAGAVADLTFQTFAQYMARLVSYYNKGSLTTEDGGVITNPAGTANRVTWWELWNEPDLDNETPCTPPTGVGLTPDQYVTMWNAATAAMLSVDATLKFVGPATAGGQFGSSTTTGNDYIDALMDGGTVRPSAISFHGYGYWDNTVTDQTIFDGDSTGAGGIGPGIVQPAQQIRANYPTLPIWLTEVNVNADWGDDAYQRPWTAFGAAWWGSAVSQLAPVGVAMIHQFDVIDAPQFGLLDGTSGSPRLPYWEQMVLNAAFPTGSTLLSSTSSESGIQTLAAQRSDGSVAVLVVDRALDSATAKGGPGLPATVTVHLPFTPSKVTAQQLDAATPIATGPEPVSLSATQDVMISFGGYGFAVVTAAP